MIHKEQSGRKLGQVELKKNYICIINCALPLNNFGLLKDDFKHGLRSTPLCDR